MTFDPDDARLTAYALDELEGEERSTVEAILAEHDAARRQVEEIRSLGRILGNQLREEPMLSLAATQREAIEASLQPVVATLPARTSWVRVLRYGIAAGALALVSGASYIAWQSQQAKFRGPEPRRVTQDFDTMVATAAKAPAPNTAEWFVEAQKEQDLGVLHAAPSGPAGGYGGAMAPATTPTTAEAPPAVLGRAQLGMPVLKTDGAESRAALYALMPSESAPRPSTPLSTAAGLSVASGATTRGLGMRQGQFGAGAGAVEGARARSLNKPEQKPADSYKRLDALAEGEQDRLSDVTESFSQLRGAEKDGEAKEVKLKKGEALADPAKPLAQLSDEGKTELQRAPAQQGLGEIESLRRRISQVQARFDTRQFGRIVENDLKPVTAGNTLSTFSVDVDTAAYANMRGYLMQENTLPPPDSVRIEELVNYFTYDYPEPSGDAPFSVDAEVTRCPWNSRHSLLRVGLKGRSVSFANRQPANLVFLVDVSGSMDQPNKLPLVKAGLRMLVNELGENDKISIVTYANGSGVALPPTVGFHKPEILEAIDKLNAGGSTNGAAGINDAYRLAQENFVKGGINRVILATDGDFNVGITDGGSLTRMAEEKAKTGVFLTALGFGRDNLKDETLEQIADKGNGQYGYIDTLMEGRKHFVEQIGGTLVTIAKDVKIQLDFNPAKVGAYRQIGYENRQMAAQDFRNDAKDAGEIGSGHTVTALYELIPPGEEAAKLAAKLPGSEFVKPAQVTDEAKQSDKLLTVRLRYKQPEGEKGIEFDQAVKDEVKDLGKASSDTKFAASVALFGMLLRGSQYSGSGTLDAVQEMAESSRGRDPGGYRAEFIELVKKAKIIVSESDPNAK